MAKNDIRNDALAFVRSFSKEPLTVEIDGHRTEILQPSLSRALRLIGRFPASAEFVASASIGMPSDGMTDAQWREMTGQLWLKAIVEEGPRVAFAWLAECLGHGGDDEFEAALEAMRDDVQAALFAKSIEASPEATRAFFAACVGSLGLPAQKETVPASAGARRKRAA